jgi:hypothetical protein
MNMFVGNIDYEEQDEQETSVSDMLMENEDDEYGYSGDYDAYDAIHMLDYGLLKYDSYEEGSELENVSSEESDGEESDSDISSVEDEDDTGNDEYEFDDGAPIYDYVSEDALLAFTIQDSMYDEMEDGVRIYDYVSEDELLAFAIQDSIDRTEELNALLIRKEIQKSIEENEALLAQLKEALNNSINENEALLSEVKKEMDKELNANRHNPGQVHFDIIEDYDDASLALWRSIAQVEAYVNKSERLEEEHVNKTDHMSVTSEEQDLQKWISVRMDADWPLDHIFWKTLVDQVIKDTNSDIVLSINWDESDSDESIEDVD